MSTPGGITISVATPRTRAAARLLSAEPVELNRSHPLISFDRAFLGFASPLIRF
jgi:hypothetical protein